MTTKTKAPVVTSVTPVVETAAPPPPAATTEPPADLVAADAAKAAENAAADDGIEIDKDGNIVSIAPDGDPINKIRDHLDRIDEIAAGIFTHSDADTHAVTGALEALKAAIEGHPLAVA